MKILFIVPGSGDSFYCGNCFRDSLYADALRRDGHDVVVTPLYLPIKNEAFRIDAPIFFPATTFYLAQKFFSHGRVPRPLARLFGSGFMLRMAASFSGTTTAKGLEEMTLSMIRGDDAVFAHMAAPLIEWIATHDKPDIIHISSSLLSGIARVLKQTFMIPTLCSLQDEEVWIDALDEKYARQAWDGIAANIKYIDLFVASSHFYKKVAQERIPGLENVEVVYPGVDRQKYAAEHYPQMPTTGFFYHTNRANGLDILAGAFALVKRRGSVPGLRLKVGGGGTFADRKFLKKVKQTLSPWKNDVEWSDSYDLNSHAEFYKAISAICVPLTFDEGIGLYLCEAFAAGRPAIEPATGSFCESVGEAGVLYSPNTVEALADAIEKLFADSETFGRYCSEAVRLSRERYSSEVAAERLSALYGSLTTRDTRNI